MLHNLRVFETHITTELAKMELVQDPIAPPTQATPTLPTRDFPHPCFFVWFYPCNTSQPKLGAEGRIAESLAMCIGKESVHSLPSAAMYKLPHWKTLDKLCLIVS